MSHTNSPRESVLLAVFGLSAIFFCGSREPADEKPLNGRSTRQLGFRKGQTVRIEARGRKFEWHFRYPGSDGRLGSEDDIHVPRSLNLPEGALVDLILESDDYIYTWSSPGLGPKEIAVPELVHSLTFRASPVGQFDVLADPMCGWRMLHGDVLGQVTIRTPSAFDDWSARLLSRSSVGSSEIHDE